jgi:3-oxoacyl-[acyl-carrier protein] reductase
MFDLTGRVALITGASGGIGGAITRALHGQGAAVALAGRNRSALEALSASLGARTVVLEADLADPGAAEALVKGTEAVLGSLDILVNNAGLTRDTLLLRMKDEDWQTVIDVDLTAAFRLTRSAIRGMLRRRWGRVVSISSVVGATGNPGQANYAAAKAGLAGLTKAVAAEVAERGITVNCVAPGFIATAMTETLTEAQRAAILGRVPAGRLGTGEEVAACVAFLASAEAAYVTGQTVHVNGGMAMI